MYLFKYKIIDILLGIKQFINRKLTSIQYTLFFCMFYMSFLAALKIKAERVFLHYEYNIHTL